MSHARRCVLSLAGRCRGLEAGEELPELRAHPFLRDASWCVRCADVYMSPRVTVEAADADAPPRELDHWPQDAEGMGSLCVLCGRTGRTLMCCDGACGGYFATCEGCAVRLMGLDEAAVRDSMADEASHFHCVFCRAGAAAALRDDAYEWLRKNRLFLSSARTRAPSMKAAAAAAVAVGSRVLVPWVGDEPAGDEPAGDEPAGDKPPQPRLLLRVPGARAPREVRLRGESASARVVRVGPAFRLAPGAKKRLSSRLAEGLAPDDFSVAVVAGALRYFLYLADEDVQREPEAGLIESIRRALPGGARADTFSYELDGERREAPALPPPLLTKTSKKRKRKEEEANELPAARASGPVCSLSARLSALAREASALSALAADSALLPAAADDDAIVRAIGAYLSTDARRPAAAKERAVQLAEQLETLGIVIHV